MRSVAGRLVEGMDQSHACSSSRRARCRIIEREGVASPANFVARAFQQSGSSRGLLKTAPITAILTSRDGQNTGVDRALRVFKRTRRWIALAPVPAWSAIALALFSLAAASAPGAPTGKFAGLIAGAILIPMLGYAPFDYLRPLLHNPDSGLMTAMLVLAGIAILKIAVMPFFPGFGADVGSYQAWAGQIATRGPAHTYQEAYFLAYPPGYLYALWVVGLISNWIGA